MKIRYLLVATVLGVTLAACSEPKRTPDGHLMERPKMSAYGPDDVTRHDTATDTDDGTAKE